MTSARQLLRWILSIVVFASLVVPSPVLAGGAIGGNYSCPHGMEINETAKFCDGPGGKTVPVKGHPILVSSATKSHKSWWNTDRIVVAVLLVVFLLAVYLFIWRPGDTGSRRD